MGECYATSGMSPHPNGGDTDPRLERRQIEAIRAMTASEKLRQVFELTEVALALHRAGVRKRYPGLTEAEWERISVEERYGEDAARLLFGPPKP